MKRFRNLVWFNPQKLHGLHSLVRLFLLIGALCVVTWMSVDPLLIMYTREIQLRNAVRLEREVSQLRSSYLQADPDSLEADLQQAEQFLIPDFSQLANWAQVLQEEGERWNLLMQYRILQTENMDSPIQGVALVPLELQVRPQDTRSGYRNFLQFMKALIRSGPKVHLQKVLVTGDGQKAMQLTIGLSVWMKAIDSVKL